MKGRIEAGDQSAEMRLAHAGAAGSGRSAVVAPDVEENRGTGANNRPAGRFGSVVADEKLDTVRVVGLAHLLLELPGSSSRALEADVAVVVLRRADIAHPEIARADTDFRDTAVVFDGRLSSRPQPTDGIDTGRRAAIALALGDAAARIRMQTEPPHQTITPEAPADGAKHAHPLTVGVFLYKRERNVGRIPPIRDTENRLRAILRQPGMSKGKAENNAEEMKEPLH